MKLNFCTLFNINYLPFGINLYESLLKTSSGFHLYIYAFDNQVVSFFEKKNFPEVTIIPLDDFENEELLSVKEERSFAEYCWTCTPSTIKHCMETYSLDHCTYIDADTYFYSDPIVLFNELGEKSVLITSHNYTPAYDKSLLSGIYCVQFMTFKNDDPGNKILNWWVNACIDWCFARKEDGKFGDQKYLDDWPIRYKNDVHVSENLGAGLAPWNIQQYYFKSNNSFQGKRLIDNKNINVVFYHYHALLLYPNYADFSSYKLSKDHITKFYHPYINELYKFIKINNFRSFRPIPKKSFTYYYYILKRRIKGTYNIYSIKD